MIRLEIITGQLFLCAGFDEGQHKTTAQGSFRKDADNVGERQKWFSAAI